MNELSKELYAFLGVSKINLDKQQEAKVIKKKKTNQFPLTEVIEVDGESNTVEHFCIENAVERGTYLCRRSRGKSAVEAVEPIAYPRKAGISAFKRVERRIR